MISYMVRTSTGSQGYLIVSRQVVSMDVGDFEYTPKPNYPGPFHIFNETDEKALLRRFFTEYQKHRPQIVVTYNGDFSTGRSFKRERNYTALISIRKQALRRSEITTAGDFAFTSMHFTGYNVTPTFHKVHRASKL